jgi:ABC-type polysaccharide/polyol phosphate export permease
VSAEAQPRRSSGLFSRAGQQLSDLFAWRQLVVDLARAELRRENARLVLGDLWWIADPLLQMVVYSVLVSVIFERTLPDYPMFVLAALIPWKGLAVSISTGCSAIIGNERVLRQLVFPRVVLPVARLLAQLWRLGVALVVMVLLMVIIWPDRVSPALVWLPVLALVQLVLILPFAIILSAATVFFRDLANFMRHVMRLALYLSPVLYSMDQLIERVPEPIAVAYRLNPVALLLEAYRDVAYYGVTPSLTSFLLPVGIGLVMLGPALAFFGRAERHFGKAL